MKYFKSHISEDCSCDDLDISVHCDVYIFQWLMAYVHVGDGRPTPSLDTAVAISILISSDFLQMDELVNTSLQFVASRLQDIIKMPIDFDCISPALLQRLSQLLTAEQLDKYAGEGVPRKDLIGHLYRRLCTVFKPRAVTAVVVGASTENCARNRQKSAENRYFRGNNFEVLTQCERPETPNGDTMGICRLCRLAGCMRTARGVGRANGV